MAILIRCECGQTMRVKEAAAGKVIACQNPECSKRHRVPRAAVNHTEASQPKHQNVEPQDPSAESPEVDWDDIAKMERAGEQIDEEPELPTSSDSWRSPFRNKRLPKGFPLMVKDCQILSPKGIPATRKCPKCGEHLWHHIHVGSLAWVGPDWADEAGEEIVGGKIGETWGWKQSWVCLRCHTVDCMVDGCYQRATIGLEHYFDVGESGSHCDKTFRTSFHNDVWCCEAHGRAIRSRLSQKALGTLAFLGGLLGVIVSLTSKSTWGTVASAIVMVPGLFVWLHHAAALSHLAKKREYILRVAPPGFAQSSTSVFEDDSLV